MACAPIQPRTDYGQVIRPGAGPRSAIAAAPWRCRGHCV